MKAFRILKRSIRDSFKSIIRNFSLSLASILSITVTLILVSVSLIMSANVNFTTKSIEEELSIIVYVKNAVNEKELKTIEKDIKNIKQVQSVKLKSKEEWKKEMVEYSDTFKTVLDYLDDNPLLDSYIVKVKDVKELEKIAEFIKSIDNVETVKYGESMIGPIISLFDVVKTGALIVVIILVLVTVFLINNTIKLTIFSRRTEIEIMRLVGASNSSIKLPFVFEGFLIGLLGSVIPIALTAYGYIFLYTSFNGKLMNDMIMLLKPRELLSLVTLSLLLIGTIVGMIGSTKAVRKYLKI